MARPLRVEYPGAIYHVMSRGNGRQRVFRDARDFQRLLEGLESSVRKFDWLVMSDHVSADQLGEARRGDMTRATAAWFARRYASATRREISTALGLSHPDSAGNMVRRIERQRVASARLRKDLAAIEKQLAKTQNRA
jgi:hypothetical protein